jgi:hypothetical protein
MRTRVLRGLPEGTLERPAWNRGTTALTVQGFDKGRGPVGLPPIGQACPLPAEPDQGPREGSLVKSRSGPAAPRDAPARISGGEAATFWVLGPA